MGDFNDICYHWKKMGGMRKDQRNIKNFTSLLEDLQLGDLVFKGQMHTRSNNRGGGDRVV